MNNFRRALADARKYWPRIMLTMLCSAAAAGLWSANIAALFPILEFSLRGESPQTWNQKRIAESETRLNDLKAKIQAEKVRTATGGNEQEVSSQSSLQDLLLSEQSENVRYASAARLQPWLDAYVPADPYDFLLAIVGILFFGSLAKQVLQTLGNMVVAKVSQDISRNIRHRVFDKTLDLDRASFLARGPSGFSVQLTQICDMLAGGIQSVFGGAVSEVLKLVACLVGAAVISWRLLLASMFFAPLAAALILWINRKLRTVSQRTLERSQSLYHVMYESLQNITTVQIFSMEEQERNRFRNATREMKKLIMRATFYRQLVAPVTELLAVSVICLSIVVGAHLFLHQQQGILGFALMDHPLGVSSLLVFLGMLIGAMDPVRRLSGVTSGIYTGMIAANALYPLLDSRPAIFDSEKPLSPSRPHSELKFSDVTFGYHMDRPILRHMSFSIPFGQTVAVIGANGTGKSTLVNLLCRFYDPQQGLITLDGIPLPVITRRDLRGRIAVVAQHTELFNETLFYNIRYGNWSASDEDVIRASQLARAHEFIEQMPEKYRSFAGPNGMLLSGGQRQRIALARALLRNPEILILDEATSQIDVESERLIHDALASFKGSRTIILITHRESALSLADRIIRLSDGTAEECDNRLRSVA